MFESGCDVIGTVPMPPEIRGMDCGLCRSIPRRAAFHKRKRDRAAGDRPRVPGGRPDEGRTPMSDSGRSRSGQGLLARWSQRKHEAKQPEPKPDDPAGESVASAGSPAPQGEDIEPEFDLSTLPKLEELTGSTDITAFLRKGVPEHLRNAALQKSWALDPAIRNYVNPRSNTPMTGTDPAGSRRRRTRRLCVDVRRAGCRRSWANLPPNDKIRHEFEDEAAAGSPVVRAEQRICRQHRRKISRSSLSDDPASDGGNGSRFKGRKRLPGSRAGR
jgi:hypothetical protein